MTNQSQNDANHYTLSSNPELYAKIKNKEMDIECGLLGKVFGTGGNSNMNIAGLIAILLITPAVCYTLFHLSEGEDSKSVLEFWKIISPLVGTILGYIFGSKQTK